MVGVNPAGIQPSWPPYAASESEVRIHDGHECKQMIAVPWQAVEPMQSRECSLAYYSTLL